MKEMETRHCASCGKAYRAWKHSHADGGRCHRKACIPNKYDTTRTDRWRARKPELLKKGTRTIVIEHTLSRGMDPERLKEGYIFRAAKAAGRMRQQRRIEAAIEAEEAHL